MNDEITDKEIHEAMSRNSLGCPNCRGRLGLRYTDGTLSPAEADIFGRMAAAHVFLLVSIEDSIEETKRQRDEGSIRRSS